MRIAHPRFWLLLLSALAVLWPPGCVEEARPVWLGGTLGLPAGAGTTVAGSGAAATSPFVEVSISQRTFIHGVVAQTATYGTRDMNRTPLQIDFNRDGRIDPVIAYQQSNQGVVQILLSYGQGGAAAYASLTLDGGDNEWLDLRDVAVGDIDGDGNPDLVLATADGIIYLHHPGDPGRTQILSEWGANSGALEIINGTRGELSVEELDGIIVQVLGPTFDRTNYAVTVQEGYTSVEIGDFDNDDFNDILASRSVNISLQPKPDFPLEPITITAGSMQLLVNPRRATTGEYWTGVSLGLHERHTAFDRNGASDLRAIDMDGDGDLDVVSAAGDDQNVQVSWFENPDGPGTIDPVAVWSQYRVGSLLGASRIDIGDVTGDGRPDIVGISALQKQCVLFVQPEEGPKRGYDWYSAPIITFENYEPRAVQIIDIDGDGASEVLIGGTSGAVRYFKPLGSPILPWAGVIVWTFDPAGDVGLLGYGDLDADGDIDLVAVVSGNDVAANRVSWLKNNTIP